MLKYEFRTIKHAEPFEWRDRGSKFIGIAKSVTTEEEVKQALKEWHEEHPNATHICFAYNIGYPESFTRANDDGEPSNSAGAPILGQIISSEIVNVLVGVVRYYGGTKLGVGGLITAYKTAARGVLEAAEFEDRVLKHVFALTCSYEDMPHVFAFLKKERYTAEEIHMEMDCRFILRLCEDELLDWNEVQRLFPSVQIENKGLKG